MVFILHGNYERIVIRAGIADYRRAEWCREDDVRQYLPSGIHERKGIRECRSDRERNFTVRPESALIEAGKVLLGRVRQLIEEKFSFALETTLSGKSYVDLIHRAKAMGFTIRLYYIYLNSVELSINRIEDRVRKGGHNVPCEIVMRRYERSLKNLFSLYLPLADEWELFDNSGSECRLIAVKNGEETNVVDRELYASILNTYGC